MSFVITHRKNTAWRKMVIRQQLTDLIVYNSIETTKARAKELQRHADKLITLSKKNTLSLKRKILSILLNNKKMSKQDILKKLTTTLAPKYINRHGGYTRVLNINNRIGDNTKMAIIQLV